jgi:hypothetical protein
LAFPRTTRSWYRELLTRGRSLVIANVDVDDPDLASVEKAVFERQGSEDMDEARKKIPPAA